MSGLDANGRVDRALRLLAPALQPIIERELRRVYRGNWRQNLSVAHGTDISKPLDAYSALKTMIDNWQSCFKDTFKQKTRTDVSKALDGRNAVAHTSNEILAADAISYLTAIRGIAEAISAKTVIDGVRPPPRLWASHRISRSRPLPRRLRRSSISEMAGTAGKHGAMSLLRIPM
jgi:hypothetical protein